MLNRFVFNYYKAYLKAFTLFINWKQHSLAVTIFCVSNLTPAFQIKSFTCKAQRAGSMETASFTKKPDGTLLRINIYQFTCTNPPYWKLPSQRDSVFIKSWPGAANAIVYILRAPELHNTWRPWAPNANFPENLFRWWTPSYLDVTSSTRELCPEGLRSGYNDEKGRRLIENWKRLNLNKYDRAPLF